MILLFLTTITFAADVFEFCSIERQRWNEKTQQFETELVSTYYSYDTIQFIVYDHSFEINRDVRPIIETKETDNKICWREHENSELCWHKKMGLVFWEWNTRAGATLRDVMGICRVNGE